MADFVLLAKRALEPAQFKLFRWHFLDGADWKLCSRKLEVDRGTFFHEVYRIEQKLGRYFAEVTPHALWPVDAHFASTPKERAVSSLMAVQVEHAISRQFVKPRYPWKDWMKAAA